MGWKILSTKVKIVNTFGFVIHTVCVATTQLCPCSTKAATCGVNERVYLHSRKTLSHTTNT